MVDSNGELLYRLERQVPYDTPYPALVLSDDGGRGLVLNAFDGIVEFIDPRVTVSALAPVSGEEPSYERILKCSVSGARVAFLVSDPTSPPALVHAMQLEGTPFAVTALSEEHGGELYLSDDGQLIIAGGTTASETFALTTSLLAWNGSLLDTVAIDFRMAAMFAGGTRVALADTRTVVEVDLETGEHRRLWVEPRPEAIITALGYYDQGVMLVSQEVEFRGGPARFTEARAVALSSDGTTRLDRMLESESTVVATVAYAEGEIRVTLGDITTSLLIER